MKITKFKGIDNINVPEKLEPGACLEARNVIFNGTGVARRPGTKLLVQGDMLGSYGTFDRSQLFYVKPSKEIVRFDGVTHTVVGSVAQDSACFWAEESGSKVFMAQYDAIYEWDGATFGPLSQESYGLDSGTKPLTVPGEIIRLNWISGRLCVASYADGFSRLTFSVAGMYGRQTINEDWFEIPHRVTGLEAYATNLIVTCLDAVFVYNVENGLLYKKLEYGTPVGRPIARAGIDKALIWTNRGVIEYPSFKNLTLDHFSAKPGEGCGSAIIQYEGNEYLIISNDGLGVDYNVQDI